MPYSKINQGRPEKQTEERTVSSPQNQPKTHLRILTGSVWEERVVSMQGMRDSQKESYIDLVFKTRVPDMPEVETEL